MYTNLHSSLGFLDWPHKRPLSSKSIAFERYSSLGNGKIVYMYIMYKNLKNDQFGLGHLIVNLNKTLKLVREVLRPYPCPN